MRNNFLNRFQSIIKIKVTGRNVNNYLKKLIKKQIPLIKVLPISYKEVHIILKYEDYLKIAKEQTIYDIDTIGKYGKLKIKDKITKNLYLLIFLVLGIFFLYFLSNIIFNVTIIHSSNEVIKLVQSELDHYGLKKYTFKKNYQELEKIETKILDNNKDSLEWIEIETVGTKYIVRVQERLLNEDTPDEGYQHIVATKNAIITEIDAMQGEKVKEINNYVTKGDIIISGTITLPDNTQKPTSAKGQVFGEVWYTVTVEYPFIYREETATGKTKTVYSLNFLNHKWSLFNFEKFTTYKANSKILLKNNWLPISLTKEKQYELNVIDEFYTEEEAIAKAISKAEEKLKGQNDRIKEIKKVTILEKNSDSSKIKLKLFISVIEEIGEKQSFTEESINNNSDTNN